MKFRITGVFLSLILALVAPAVVSATSDQSKGPPDLERTVFIHSKYQDAKPGGGNTSKTPTLYSYSRYHWQTSAVTYLYNPVGSQVTNTEAGVDAAFQTWSSAGSGFRFIDGGLTSIAPGVNATSPDYKNVVGWALLDDANTVGLTIIWSNPRTKMVVDVDTVLNLDSGYAWTQADISGDPDLALLAGTSLYDVDVQAIMSHEAGHWLVLNDLYTSAANEQTMYGYASDRESKKRSLESGDIAGVLKIYP